MIARRLSISTINRRMVRGAFPYYKAVSLLIHNLKAGKLSGCVSRQSYDIQRRYYSMEIVNPVSLSAFNSNHESYDIYRSSYPNAAVEFAATLNRGQYILEVGAGTGKFTSQVLSHVPSDRLVVLEPSSGMLSSFRKKHPHVEAIQSSSDNIPFDDNSFDTIYVAQAFHWFANRDTLEEFYRVLRPLGRIVLVWNFEDVKHMKPDGWQKRTTELVWKYDNDVPQYRHKKWEEVLKSNADLFAPYCERVFPYQKLVESAEALWSYWKTRSYIHNLDKLQQSQLEEEILDIARTSPTPLVAARGCHVVWLESQKPSFGAEEIIPKRL